MDIGKVFTKLIQVLKSHEVKNINHQSPLCGSLSGNSFLGDDKVLWKSLRLSLTVYQVQDSNQRGVVQLQMQIHACEYKGGGDQTERSNRAKRKEEMKSGKATKNLYIT